MQQSIMEKFEKAYQKPETPSVRSGDTVRVHQKVIEGSKERIQPFEGVVIRTKRMNSHTAFIIVRRIASGIGVEKGFMLHSPNVEKLEVVRRSKVRRNYLSFLRQRQGKSARLQEVYVKQGKTEVDEAKPSSDEQDHSEETSTEDKPTTTTKKTKQTQSKSTAKKSSK